MSLYRFDDDRFIHFEGVLKNGKFNPIHKNPPLIQMERYGKQMNLMTEVLCILSIEHYTIFLQD